MFLQVLQLQCINFSAFYALPSVRYVCDLYKLPIVSCVIQVGDLQRRRKVANLKGYLQPCLQTYSLTARTLSAVTNNGTVRELPRLHPVKELRKELNSTLTPLRLEPPYNGCYLHVRDAVNSAPSATISIPIYCLTVADSHNGPKSQQSPPQALWRWH